MTFRVGQKVVCIEDFSYVKQWGFSAPLKGQIYIIRDLTNEGSEPGLRVAEVVNPPMKHKNYVGLIEPAFPTSGFRPLVDTKSEISFTQGAPKDSKRFDNRRKIKERA